MLPGTLQQKYSTDCFSTGNPKAWPAIHRVLFGPLITVSVLHLGCRPGRLKPRGESLRLQCTSTQHAHLSPITHGLKDKGIFTLSQQLSIAVKCFTESWARGVQKVRQTAKKKLMTCLEKARHNNNHNEVNQVKNPCSLLPPMDIKLQLFFIISIIIISLLIAIGKFSFLCLPQFVLCKQAVMAAPRELGGG